ncbi:uncharacterized protein LOC100370320 [Saccoglossus kowalevskii]|uniref:Uncharacterized protein LOC100370320 n=1 Tax=Saccoglossus kowalevskii TaxID=10224 RepID=A0ABM0GVL0_SACKO|nr:PREDICTED: uncharacterized protein LOC100370320 [Saccoglossus kowalevskii]
MKLHVVVFLFAVIGAAVTEDVDREDEKTGTNKPVERELHHLSHKSKSELENRRKEHLKAHPDVEGSPKIVVEGRKLPRHKEEKMMEIRNSELSPEEKALKLENVKQYFRSQMKSLVKEANSHAKLAAERRRTLEQRKEERKHAVSARKPEKQNNRRHPKFRDWKVEN